MNARASTFKRGWNSRRTPWGPYQISQRLWIGQIDMLEGRKSETIGKEECPSHHQNEHPIIKCRMQVASKQRARLRCPSTAALQDLCWAGFRLIILYYQRIWHSNDRMLKGFDRLIKVVMHKVRSIDSMLRTRIKFHLYATPRLEWLE